MANEVCEECGTRCAVGAPRCPQCSSTRLVPEGELAALVPSLTVACSNQACPAEGTQRRVALNQVVPGVLVLPRLVCARCGYELPKVTEDIVPKITVHGGPSNAAAEAEAADAANSEGGEQSSPVDTTSSTSSEKESSSPEQSEKPDPSPARGAGSRSKPRRTGAESGTAGSTATGGRKTAGSDE